jgi:hypothetical protein
MHLSCPPHVPHALPTSFFLINQIIFGEEYTSLRSSSCNFLHLRYINPLRPKYPHSTQRTLSPYTPPSVLQTTPHPHKTTSKITLLYISMFILLDSKLEDKRFCT